jgi:hypothetical protein
MVALEKHCPFLSKFLACKYYFRCVASGLCQEDEEMILQDDIFYKQISSRCASSDEGKGLTNKLNYDVSCTTTSSAAVSSFTTKFRLVPTSELEVQKAFPRTENVKTQDTNSSEEILGHFEACEVCSLLCCFAPRDSKFVCRTAVNNEQ